VLNPMQTPDGMALTPVQRTGRLVLRKYANIFRASLVERMAYRSDFLLGTVLRFLPVLTTILLWEAVYKGSGEDSMAGFSRREMIAYLLLIHISRMFSSMPGLAGGISRDIREGTLKKYLVQPLDMIGYLISYRAAHKAPPTSPRPSCPTQGCSRSVTATSTASPTHLLSPPICCRCCCASLSASSSRSASAWSASGSWK